MILANSVKIYPQKYHIFQEFSEKDTHKPKLHHIFEQFG